MFLQGLETIEVAELYSWEEGRLRLSWSWESGDIELLLEDKRKQDILIFFIFYLFIFSLLIVKLNLIVHWFASIVSSK